MRGELGPIEHIVHAAAIGSGKFGFPFTNLTPADWPRVFEVNVMGMVNLAWLCAALIGVSVLMLATEVPLGRKAKPATPTTEEVSE